MFNRLLLIAVLLIFFWGELFAKPAVPQLIESRLNNIEAQLRNVELRLNQIEYHANLTRPISPSRTLVSPPLSERDPMFKHLATLVVELKERVDNLAARVSKLESKS